MAGSLPQMLVAILCGGRGTRLQEHSPGIPKPLVEIGGHPILWHVIQIYAAQGYRRVPLLRGLPRAAGGGLPRGTPSPPRGGGDRRGWWRGGGQDLRVRSLFIKKK